MADTVEEQQWIRDSLAGNDAAYALLVGRYQQMIHAVTYRMTGSFSDAEDLAQETFVRAFHELKHFRGEAKFSTWLCRIAMNLSLNWRSREGRRSEVHTRWADDAYSQPAHPPNRARMLSANRCRRHSIVCRRNSARRWCSRFTKD